MLEQMPRPGPVDAPTSPPLVDVVSSDRFASSERVKVGAETILTRRIWPIANVPPMSDGEVITPLRLTSGQRHCLLGNRVAEIVAVAHRNLLWQVWIQAPGAGVRTAQTPSTIDSTRLWWGEGNKRKGGARSDHRHELVTCALSMPGPTSQKLIYFLENQVQTVDSSFATPVAITSVRCRADLHQVVGLLETCNHLLHNLGIEHASQLATMRG
jgi:hypothetical protein